MPKSDCTMINTKNTTSPNTMYAFTKSKRNRSSNPTTSCIQQGKNVSIDSLFICSFT